MRRRSLAEPNVTGLASFWVQPAERGLVLSGVPHAAIRGGRDVVRVRTFRDGVFLNIGRGGDRAGDDQRRCQQNPRGRLDALDELGKEFVIHGLSSSPVFYGCFAVLFPVLQGIGYTAHYFFGWNQLHPHSQFRHRAV